VQPAHSLVCRFGRCSEWAEGQCRRRCSALVDHDHDCTHTAAHEWRRQDRRCLSTTSWLPSLMHSAQRCAPVRSCSTVDTLQLAGAAQDSLHNHAHALMHDSCTMQSPAHDHLLAKDSLAACFTPLMIYTAVFLPHGHTAVGASVAVGPPHSRCAGSCACAVIIVIAPIPCTQVDGADALFADRYDEAEAVWAKHAGESAGCAYGLALLQVCCTTLVCNESQCSRWHAPL
jgi:hypothetical protein